MATIELKHIGKIYDKNVRAITDFNLSVKDEEFIVFVGPSGCGKSTTLRMIAGLEEISEGDFLIDGKRMNDTPPKDRDIAMVFQNYALYPHMTVFDNMGFGLKMRKFKKEEIKRRVEEAAEILDLTHLLKRKPKALSGGQRQRVALGRAIVRDAKIFLMDEPLSNLDSKLRVQMRTEIIKLHRRLKTTTIYVTHDQTEAMTMASRIVIMKDGFIQQIGTPKEVYDLPNNIFVGGFIGSPAMNFFRGMIQNGKFIITNHAFEIPIRYKEAIEAYERQEVVMGVRSEHITSQQPFNETSLEIPVLVDTVELTGAEQMVYAELEGQPLIGRADAKYTIGLGQQLPLFFHMDHVHFFDAQTEERIGMQKDANVFATSEHV